MHRKILLDSPGVVRSMFTLLCLVQLGLAANFVLTPCTSWVHLRQRLSRHSIELSNGTRLFSRWNVRANSVLGCSPCGPFWSLLLHWGRSVHGVVVLNMFFTCIWSLFVAKKSGLYYLELESFCWLKMIAYMHFFCVDQIDWWRRR